MDILAASTRKFLEVTSSIEKRLIRLTSNESMAAAQVEPPGFELARAGHRFYGGATGITEPGTVAAATGRASVTAMPTTAAAFVLFNGESAGGRSYVIEQVHIAQLSGTAAVGGVILFALTNTSVALPTQAIGYSSFNSATNNSGYRSKAVWADNQTLAAQPRWGVLGTNGNPATTTSGGASAEVGGRIIIPPGYALALNYLSGTGTTPLFLGFAQWVELLTTGILE